MPDLPAVDAEHAPAGPPPDPVPDPVPEPEPEPDPEPEPEPASLPDRPRSEAETIAYLDRMAVVYYGELGRADNKCASLLSLASGAIALLVVYLSSSVRITLPSRVVLLLATAVLALSVAVLLRLLRPRRISAELYRAAPQGAEAFAGVVDVQVGHGPVSWRRAHVQHLMVLVRTRMRQFKVAIDLLLVAVVLLTLGLLGSLVS